MLGASLRELDDGWDCFFGKWNKLRLTGEDATYFHCRSCNGGDHQDFENGPLEIEHPLHQKHSLEFYQRKHSLKLVVNWEKETRECFCCDEDLAEVFYLCRVCDCAMNIACAEKPPVLYIPAQKKWHEHTLALFPRRASLTCNLCALADSSSPIYMCPPCDFVVHLKCLNLPHVIRMSRHPHRISFNHSFDQGDRSCSVCRKEINNVYGGYSCIKNGCLYAAHARCATQSNVWDGIDLEGEPEEIEEEEVEPFVRISDGIIQHFSHEHHHLRLDECEECIFYIECENATHVIYTR
ncbi:unnamed protein product [Microthlaspi erraticum]|uniref:DC1 domain-containing protein n=1 Tax=Microthlaspi erraticum TaxID=1685480 RepID=A0A6D2I8H1_9BRAS|nr:unnamed protein product [Microthlaspi erraticum]